MSRQHRSVTKPAGTLQQLQIDATKFPTPVRTVIAEACAVIDHGYTFEFLLWSYNREQTRAFSVRVPVDAVAGQLWNSSREFHSTLRDLADRANLDAPSVEPQNGIPETSEVVWGNVFLMYRQVMEAQIDCYYLAPRQLFLASTGKSPDLEPIVSVRLTVPLVLGILNFIDEIHSEATSRLGAFASGQV